MSVALAPDAAARTSCSYVGAPTNSLTVTANDEAFGRIRRNGSEIAVWEYEDPPVPCAGGVPTVLNTDPIVLRASRTSFVDVRLRGPATVNDEDVDVTATNTSRYGYLVVDGRAGDDTITPAAGARIPHFAWAEGDDGATS